MKAFTLAGSSIAVLLALGCGSGSGTPTNTGTGGDGEQTGGSGGSPGTGGSPDHTGGAPGATGGAGGTVSPDAGAGGSSGGATGSPDASATGGQGGGGQGGSGGSPDGGAGMAETWDSFAKGFFATYCVSCHNDDKKGDATRDYHLMANVVKEKAEIACGVSKGQADWSKRGCTAFPPARQFPVGGGPKPTDAERDRLVRWIDSGTP
jgi:hypothetical protein